MSDTPLTDAIGIMLGHSRHDDDQIVKMINHARTLERENARLRGALEGILAITDRDHIAWDAARAALEDK